MTSRSEFASVHCCNPKAFASLKLLISSCNRFIIKIPARLEIPLRVLPNILNCRCPVVVKNIKANLINSTRLFVVTRRNKLGKIKLDVSADLVEARCDHIGTFAKGIVVIADNSWEGDLRLAVVGKASFALRRFREGKCSAGGNGIIPIKMKFSGKDMRRLAVAMAAVFAVTFAVYLPCVSFEFVDYDDTDYVLVNEHLKGGLTPENVRWAFASRGYASNWHPLTWMSHMADVNLLRLSHLLPKDVAWGEWDSRRGTGDAWFTKLSQVMHLHNVFLHAANASLLLLLMVVMGKSVGAGVRDMSSCLLFAFLTLFWALHPLRVEVVCWVSERKELLSCFFMLMTMICYCCAATAQPNAKRQVPNAIHRAPDAILYLLSLVFAALAMLAKPVAVTLPVVLLAWEWIFRCRLAVLRLAPFAAMSFLTCVFTMQSQVTALDSGATLSIASRLATVFLAPLVYIRQTFWPLGLSVLYEATQRINLVALAGGVLLIVLMVAICMVWLVRRVRRPRLIEANSSLIPRFSSLDLAVFAIAWLYGGLIPMLGIVKVGCQEHCDRYTYWIGCGACAVAALAWTRLAPFARAGIERLVRSADAGDEARVQKECGDVRRVCFGGAVAVVIALVCLTVPQMMTWRNTVTLYRNAVPKSWSSELAKVLAVQLAYREPKGAEEGEKWLRKCATNHRTAPASLNLAEYCLAFRRHYMSVMKFGGTAFAEIEMLVEEARAMGVSGELAEQADKIMETVEKARKEAKE